MTEAPQSRCQFNIEPDFEPYATSAIVRLSYLFPELKFERIDSTIEIHGDISDSRHTEILREVSHQLYREKIYAETLAIRKSLYSNE